MEAPGTGTLADQIKGLQQRVTELGRRRPVPVVCQAYLTRTTEYAGEVGDRWARGDWAVGIDTTSTMAELGDAGVISAIRIPVTGWYYLHYHAALALPSGAQGSIKIARNDPVVTTSSVATAAALRSTGYTPLDAIRPHIHLQAGDRLYWSSYASQMPFDLAAAVYTMPTEITVMYLHS